MAQRLYQERTGRAGLPMPGQVSVPTMPVNTRGVRLVGAVAQAGQQIGAMYARQYAADQQTRIEESLLAARKEFAEWQAQYVQERQGGNALNAGADFQAKMQEIAGRHLAAFDGADNEVFRQELGGQLAALGVRAAEQGASYATQQRRMWENSVLEGMQAQLLADAESEPGNGAWLDHSLTEYRKAIEARGIDPTATMQELTSAVQLRRGLSYVQRGEIDAADALLQGWRAGGVHPGDISARYESGAAGSAAIGYDGTGGTSYGKWQFSSRQGSLDAFLRFLDSKGGEAAAVAARLRKAGPANTGGKTGAMPEAWKREAGAQAFGAWEREFVQRHFFEPALRSLPDGAAAVVQQSPALQQMIWSTAVQHGAAGAADIFRKAWREGMSEADLVRATYAERAARLGSSEPDVRASVQRRLRREAEDILGGISGAGGVNGMSLQAAMQLQGAVERERARLEREAERQQGNLAVDMAGDIVSQAQDRPREEREAFALQRVATIEDARMRNAVQPLVAEQLRYMREAEQERDRVETATRIRDFAAQVRTQGLDPIAAARLLQEQPLSREAGLKAMERAFGRISENAENRAALDALRRAIDRGEVVDTQQIEIAAMHAGMTDAQIRAAGSYLEQSGRRRGASLSAVERLYARLTNGKAMPEGFYDAVAASLPEGREPSAQELERIVSNLEMDGR